MRWLTIALALIPSLALATAYRVGPSRALKDLAAVRGLLEPGDLVELDGDATYAGGVLFDRPGSVERKITVRGKRVRGKRPILTGGKHTVEARGDHYVFEGLELTQGEEICFFHHADDITLRDSVVHDCPRQGILGGDHDSGSLLLEYSEVHHCGGGLYEHQIYMAADPVRHPEAVFRMQLCYVHHGNGGNNVKTRAPRNEIYSNWIEGALYHELECIGSDGHPEDAVREDSDVVGNVFVKTHDSPVTRFGGDGTGQTKGRYRFVSNTVLVVGTAPVFRLFDGIESLEFHDNVFASSGPLPLSLVSEKEVKWVTGQTTIAGRNNWIPSSATLVPGALEASVRGASPGFVDLAARDLRPATGSPLVDAGASAASGPAGHPFIRPLATPLYLPPAHTTLSPGGGQRRQNVGAIDIGAFEQGDELGAKASRQRRRTKPGK